MHHKDRLRQMLRLLGHLLTILALVFLVRTAAGIRPDLGEIQSIPFLLAASAAGLLIKMLTVYLQGRAWIGWLEALSGRTCDRRAALSVYARANMGKYLPGNVMHFVERNLFAADMGLSQRELTAASLF